MVTQKKFTNSQDTHSILENFLDEFGIMPKQAEDPNRPATTPDEPIVYELVARDALYKPMVPCDTEWAYATTTALDLDYIKVS